MGTSHYGYGKKVDLPFEQAVERVKEVLKEEGFRVLTEIDVRATLKKKLAIDFPEYVILGACNPPNAYKALQAEREIGLLLPCNVIVYKEEDGVHVSAILPTVAMGMIANERLQEIAAHIENKLKQVIDAV